MLTLFSTFQIPDDAIAALYPEDDNYVSTSNGCQSPKSLVELALDTLCRNLPRFDGELPPGLPQDVVDDIISSLVSHSALNATTLRALRNCELRSLNLASCRLVTDDWLHSLSQQDSSPSNSPISTLSSLAAADDIVMEEVDIEAQNPSSETFYGTFEDLSHSSGTSFVSAKEDHPMEDARLIERGTPSVQSIPCCATSSLTILDLRGSHHLTDRGLLQLPILQYLEEVRLDNCHSLVGHGLLACSSSRALHTVSLSNCRRLTDTAVINISHISLQNLFLGGCRCLTDRSLSALGEMRELHRLDLSRCDLITDKGLESLEGLVALEEVNIGWCRLITDAGLDCLTRQPHRDHNLRVLSIARCHITNDGMDHIGRLTALEELDMNGCTDVQSYALANALGRLHNLTHLNASYCPNIL